MKHLTTILVCAVTFVCGYMVVFCIESCSNQDGYSFDSNSLLIVDDPTINYDTPLNQNATLYIHSKSEPPEGLFVIVPISTDGLGHEEELLFDNGHRLELCLIVDGFNRWCEPFKRHGVN